MTPATTSLLKNAQSDTPLTDAALHEGLQKYSQMIGDKHEMCYAPLFQRCCDFERDRNALLAALEAIAQALDGERNRFGKLEIDRRQAEPLRLLAVQYQTPGARDTIDQSVNVARAAIENAKARS